MSTIAFVHDHVFSRNNGLYFSPGRITHLTWDRFFKSFDAVSVICRYVDCDDVYGLSLSSRDRVSFRCIPRSKNIFKRGVEQLMLVKHFEECLMSVDAVCVRLPSFLGSAAFLAAKKLGKPVAVEVVACPYASFYTHGSYIAKSMALFERLKLRRLLYNHPDMVIYVTDDYLQDLYPTNCDLVWAISNVELPNINFDLREKEVRLINAYTNNFFRIGFVGSLECDYKGLGDLLVTLSNIVEFGFHLFVLGNGNPTKYEKQAVKLGIANNVTFCGVLSGGYDVLRWLEKIDIYMHPSRTEGLPRSLIEAMYAGCPAIASNVGGIPQLISQDYLHHPGNVDQMKKKLTNLCSNLDFILNAHNANRKKACEFSSDILAKTRETAWAEFRDIKLH